VINILGKAAIKSATMARTRLSQAGFTLIEIATVISIIAILAAILFPVFAAAREKARQTTCFSNLGNIGLALQMYAEDWGGNYPPQEDNLAPIARRVKIRGIFACPSMIGTLTIPEMAKVRQAQHKEFLIGVYHAATRPNPIEYDTVMIADGMLMGCSYYYHAGLTNESPGNLLLATERMANHNGNANVLLSSGRIISVPHQQWVHMLPKKAQRTSEELSKAARAEYESSQIGVPGARKRTTTGGGKSDAK
jgi:prepilin-type N-terminal cleavage/methylation domain-containing protein